ncbi:MAG: J domain-containing protein [Candidatus Hydrogenedentes bacterium]|nr:J domain-containing protein [Candidatus Hydrogenedentota bacterium]
MFGTGIPEIFFIILIITVLSMSGLWPSVIRGLRELRGERVEEQPPATSRELDLSCRLLGISPSAPWEEIEKAYRRKAKIHHPDLGGDEDAMRALNEAYSLLKRMKKR